MKCSCTSCSGQIEYDAASAGLEICCPHCNQPTRLAAFSAGPPPLPASAPYLPKKKSSAWIIVLIIAGALALMLPVVGLLTAIAIPNFVKARHQSQSMACAANLRTIDAAKATWALELKKHPADVPTEDDLFGPTRLIKQKPTCPAGGVYTINAVDAKPTCSIAGHSF